MDVVEVPQRKSVALQPRKLTKPLYGIPRRVGTKAAGCEANLHHRRNPGMIRFPCKNQQTIVSPGVQVVQDCVHPQWGSFSGLFS